MNGLVFPCILIGYLWCNMRFVTFLVTTAGTRYSMFCTIVNTRNISTASANNMSSKAFCLKTYLHVIIKTMGCSSNQIKSNQIKSLLLSHHHSTSALVSEILMSVLQTVQKNNRQFTYGQTVQKNNRQFTYGQTVQKNNKQFTYGQYIFTDCTEDNVQNTHTYTQYT